MTWIEIAGGVALTLFGIRFLRKGLDRLFGGRLATWLASLTARPLRAFAAGAAAGTVAPSSTGISLLSLQIIGAGKLGAERVLAVLLGAGAGITVTIQLLAFRIQDYAPLLLVAGVGCFQFTRRETLRGIGQCLLSLGFVFLAMRLIGEGGESLASASETREALALLEGHPLIVAAAALALAVALQSSTATIGLGLGLLSAGLLSAGLAVPWVIGTNLGLGLTSLIVGWPVPEGRKLGLASLLVKALAAAPLLLVPSWGAALFGWLPGSELRQVAMFHTAFNLVPGLAALPFLGVFTRIAAWMIGPPASRQAEDEGRPATHLDPRAVESPGLALVHATREVLRMVDETRAMLGRFWRLEEMPAPTPEQVRAVQRHDDRIDELNRSIRAYLACIHEHMTERDSQWQFMLLGFINELETAGDIIDKHLCDALLKRGAGQVRLTDGDHAALAELHRMVDARLEQAAVLLTTRDEAQAGGLLAAKDALGEWAHARQLEHFQRLASGGPEALASSIYFLDMFNHLRRIGSQVCNVAFAFLPNADGRPDAPH